VNKAKGFEGNVNEPAISQKFATNTMHTRNINYTGNYRWGQLQAGQIFEWP